MAEIRRALRGGLLGVRFAGGGLAMASAIVASLSVLSVFTENDVLAFPEPIPIGAELAASIVGTAIGGFVAGLVTIAAGRWVGGKILPSQYEEASAGSTTGRANTALVSRPAVMRVRFTSVNLLGAGFFGVLAIGTLLDGVLPNDVLTGIPLDESVLLLGFLADLLGGLVVVSLAALVFAAIWIGLREEMTEALVAGIVCWTGVALVGALAALDTPMAATLAVAGVIAAAYGVRARTATEPEFLDALDGLAGNAGSQ